MRNAVLIGFFAFCTAGCSQPMGPIAGGALNGDPAKWPDDWSFTDDLQNVLLETNPEDPYSVTIWCVEHDGELFIAAAEKEHQWVAYIAQDQRVRLNVDGSLYEARATHIHNVDEIVAILPAYVAKYEFDYEGNFVEDGILYRLDPR